MIALIIGMLVSLIVTLVGTPLLIRLVHKLHYGQYIRQDGPQSHLVKRGTPTLGGVVINFAIVLEWVPRRCIDTCDRVMCPHGLLCWCCSPCCPWACWDSSTILPKSARSRMKA